MTINHIGISAMSLHVTESELKTLSLSPEKIGKDEALSLLRLALTEKRLDDWEVAELEVYPGRDSVLVFARRRSGSPKHFLFRDFEALVQAAHLASDLLPSCLARTDDGYVLTVYPFEGDRPPAVLYEYGDAFAGTAYLTAHWKEQQQLLIEAEAISCLQAHFAPK